MVSDVSDEFVPGIQDVETQNRLAITLNQRAAIRPKPSIHFTYVCSQATTVVDDEVDNENVPPVVPPGHNSVLGLKFTDPTHLEDELVSELSFTPEVTSTQRCEESTDSPTDSSNNIQAGETTLPNANAKQNPLDLNRLDSWLRAMRNPAEAVETLQPEILHVPINSSKASVLPEALHDTPIPTPLGESWTGPPLSRQEVESRLQQQSLQSKTWGQMMQEQEDL